MAKIRQKMKKNEKREILRHFSRETRNWKKPRNENFSFSVQPIMGTKILGYKKKDYFISIFSFHPKNSYPSPLLENMNVASHPVAIAFICHVGAQICPISVSFFTPTAHQHKKFSTFFKKSVQRYILATAHYGQNVKLSSVSLSV